MIMRSNRQPVLKVVQTAAAADPLARTQATLDNMSRAHARVGKLLLGDPQAFAQLPIADLATAAQVSEPTIIRFCRQLGFGGLPDLRISLAMHLALIETGGGERAFIEPRISDKAGVNLKQKREIARFALNLVGMDRSIIVDSGSTTQFFAEALRDLSGRIVFTTGLNIAETLASAPHHTVILSGGTFRSESRSVSGPLVEACLQGMNFDTYFVGADSIDLEVGLSTFNEVEAQQNRAMMRAARRVVVLADSSKFRAPALHRICSLKDINVIVTDGGLPDDVARGVEALGIELHRVGSQKKS